MESILIVQSRAARRLAAIEVDRSLLPSVKRFWHATSQGESIRIIRKHKPGLVILDVSNSSGKEFELFEETKEQAYQKIILCDSDSYAFKVLRFGIDDYLLKPAGSAEITAAIEKLLFREKKYNIQQLYNSRRSQNLVKVTTAFFSTPAGVAVTESADIIRIADMGTHRSIFLSMGRTIQSELPIKSLASLLPEDDFLMIAPSELINMAQIATAPKKRERLFVMLVDGSVFKVPIMHEERILRYRQLLERRTKEQFPWEGEQ